MSTNNAEPSECPAEVTSKDFTSRFQDTLMGNGWLKLRGT